jgi:hypothetical protein
MIETHDELLMEMAEEYGPNHMGENNDEENEDNDDGGDATAPPAPVSPVVAPEEIIEEEAPMEMVPEQEALEAHEVILADAKPELPQPCLFSMIMRDYEESPSNMVNGLHEQDDLDDLDDPTEADYDVDDWFPEDGSNDQD